MLIIEASRRVSRAAVERVRDALIEYDRIAFKNVDYPAEDAFIVIRQGRSYVLGFEDPTLEWEEVA
jgi:hypothetical protein